MNLKTLGPDLKAGIVVYLVALPLCLGIALACKAPLISGLISGIIGGIFVTIFSGSVLSVSGPAAGLTAVVLSSVSTLGSPGIFAAAVICAGLLQIILGLLKAGSIGNYIPNAVIKGMLAGIGLILIIKQIPHLVGYDKDPEGDFNFERDMGQNTFSDLLDMLNAVTPGAVIIGLLSLLIIIFTDRPAYKNNRILALIPGPLIVVAAGVILNMIFSSSISLKIAPEHLVSLPVISSMEEFRQVLIVPDYSAVFNLKFWTIAGTLAIVASLESLLSIEATDKLDPKKRKSNSNKELLAQGIGNTLCGLCGALPVTAVIVRSSANINAGAQTKLSAMIHAVLLLVTVLAIPNILMLIPNASLAAILVATGYKLVKPSLFKEHYKKGYDQLLPFVVTIVVMLFTDLLKGVGAGLVVSVIFIIRANISNSFETANSVMNERLHYIIKLPQHITFFNKGFLTNYFARIKEDSVVIIDGSINKTMDKDARDVIMDFLNTTKDKNINVDLVKTNL